MTINNEHNKHNVPNLLKISCLFKTFGIQKNTFLVYGKNGY